MSAYQTNGKPLSQQAIYQQKLKHGVYNSPGKPSVGVASSASDAAALLAASSDLSVKPSYERLHAAPEAHTAALAAKADSRKAWSRDSTDPQADAAAANARVTKGVPTKSDLGIPASYNKGAVYKQATANSTSTMTSRSTPDKNVSKHGLASTTLSLEPSTLNIGKISQMADRNSSLALNKRFNPEQDYRLGIKPTEFLTPAEENFAAKLAGRSLSMVHGGGYTNQVSAQKRTNTFRAADVVDATLLAAASAKASERLNSISQITNADLKTQAQLYSKALTAAQKNSEERLKSHKAGLIDLGGGLTLPATEIDRLATLIVQPVLDDLGTKANAQREHEEKQREKHFELTKLHQKFKRDDAARKHEEKVQRAIEKEKRIEVNEGKKKDEDDKFAQYQLERNAEIDEHAAELSELQAQYAAKKEELIKEKTENEERISGEETELINERKKELEEMQQEKDEILQPVLDELAVESEKLKDLTDTKDQLTSEVEVGEKQKAEYEAKIAELKKKLEETDAQIESSTTEHAEFLAKRETTDKEVEELQEHTDKTLKESEESHKQLDSEIEALEQEKKEHIDTKASHKKSILQEIEDKIKGEHEINNELPEHMQDTVDEDKYRDVGSLFTIEKKEAPKPAKAAEPVVAKPAATRETSTKKKGLRSRLSGFKNAFKVPEQQPRKTTATSQPVKVKPQETPSDETTLPEVTKGGKFTEEI